MRPFSAFGGGWCLAFASADAIEGHILVAAIGVAVGLFVLLCGRLSR